MSNLISAFISHQIWLQRNASHEASLVEPFIDDMRKEVRSRVLQFGDDSRTRANLNALLRDLDNVLGGIAGEWNQLLLADLKDLGVYESQWSAKTMAANIQASFTSPSPEQVWSAIKFNPMQLNDRPVDFASWIDGWADTEVSRLTQGVKMGFVQGRTTRDIVKEVVGAGGLADISERNAKTIVRTAVAHVSNVAREATYDKNSDVIEGYEWVSTLDSKTSAICRGRDGMKFRADAEFRPKPPAHPNCLLGDTVISTCGRVSTAFKRTYKGVIVYVTTRTGRTLSITPNHQVMTTDGWVAAGDLDVGSKLICGDDIAVSFHHKEDNVVSEFSNLFGALNVSSDSSFVSTSPTAAEDFHGDGSDGEVEIVLVNSLTWDKVKSRLAKQIPDNELPSALLTDNALSRNCSFDEFGVVSLSTPDSLMSSSADGEPLFSGVACHANEHSLTGSPECNTVFAKNSIDWLERGADDLAYFNWADATGIEIDDVVDLVFGEVDFCGHVYNLENEQNWYLANGIIAHNCRSTTIPLVSSEFDFLDAGAKRAARGADGGMQVDANTSYYEFLKSQPAAFQDAALGVTRGKIFRNAGMTLEEFRAASVDGFGNPLTLKQMAEMDDRVARYLDGKTF